jgi:hypothetical protein
MIMLRDVRREGYLACMEAERNSKNNFGGKARSK